MENEWKQLLEESLNGLRFGSVEIVVHDGRISQIERRERFRAYQEKAASPEYTTSPVDRNPGSAARRTTR